MIFTKRSYQYAYFLGLVSRTKRKQLKEVYQHFSIEYGYEPLEGDVFNFCPFNDEFEQIIKGFYIYEKTKQEDFNSFLESQFREFFYLAADFVPPCCGDSRAFYANSVERELIMQCDRCMKIYTLDGSLSKVKASNLASKQEFITRFGNVLAEDWPYHKRLVSAI